MCVLIVSVRQVMSGYSDTNVGQLWRDLRNSPRRPSQLSMRSAHLDDDEASLAHTVVSARESSAINARTLDIMGAYEVDPSQVLERLRAASGGAIRSRSEHSSATSTWREQTIHEPLVESQRTLPKGSRIGGGILETRSVYDPADNEDGRSVRGVSVATSYTTPASYRLQTTYGTAEPEYETIQSPQFLQRSVLASLHQDGTAPIEMSPRRTLPPQYLLSPEQMEAVEPADVRRSRSMDRSDDSLHAFEPLMEAPPSIPGTPTERSDDEEDNAAASAATDDLLNLEIYTPEEKREQRRQAKVANWQSAYGVLKWQQTDEEVQMRAKEQAAQRAASINAASDPAAGSPLLGGFEPSDTFGISTDLAGSINGKRDKKSKKGTSQPPVASAPYNPANPAEYLEFLYEASNPVSTKRPVTLRLPEPREVAAVLHDPLNTGVPVWDPFHSTGWWEAGKNPDEVRREAGVVSGRTEPTTGVPTFVDRFNNLTYGPYAIHPVRMWMVEFLSEKFPGHNHPILHTIDTLLLNNIADVFVLEKQLVDQFGPPSSFAACPLSLLYRVKFPSEAKLKFKPLTAGTPLEILQAGLRMHQKDKKGKTDKKEKSETKEKDSPSSKSATKERDKADKKDKSDKGKDKKDASDAEKSATKEKGGRADKNEKGDKKGKGEAKEKADKNDKEKSADRKDKSDVEKPATKEKGGKIDKSEKEKADKKGKGEAKADKKDKSDKGEKDKADKKDKSDKADKKDKSDKADKKDKSDKKDKGEISDKKEKSEKKPDKSEKKEKKDKPEKKK